MKTEVRTRTLVRAIRYAMERHTLQMEIRRNAAEIESRNARVEEELKLARQIQQSYLPRQRVTFPQTAAEPDAALRFCYRYTPAEIIGGDFFSVREISRTEVGVFICDVMGHGVAAALVSATVRGLIEEMKSEAADPARFLGEMNHAIHSILRGSEMPILVTAFYMVTDIASGEMRYANAGHPAPFCIRPSTRQVHSLEMPRGDAVLGLFERTAYAVSTRTLHAGDLLMLFTDGLYEIESPFAEPYGRDRLPDDIRQRIEMAPPLLFDDLIEHIRDFSLSRRFDDDMCLVGMEVGRMGTRAGTAER